MEWRDTLNLSSDQHITISTETFSRPVSIYVLEKNYLWKYSYLEEEDPFKFATKASFSRLLLQ
uniref:Uncharacterized protein n=1 Tax=Pristionchus pacificus TaxID=54126 RepID=A0A2A6CF91_PRIPA|eukprot:PDM76748.1 hypothetical protein PRIPAC_42143 [Pristionchus pacificus]